MKMTFRPIEVWPGELLHSSARTQSPFKAGYNDTLQVLDRELEHLGAGSVVCQLAVTEYGPSWKIPKDSVRAGKTVMVDLEGGVHDAYPASGGIFPSGWCGMNRAGVKATGRTLYAGACGDLNGEDRTWDEFPA